MPNLFPAIPPNADLQGVIKQANVNFAQIDNEANTKIFKDDTGTRRVLLGRGKDGFYGIKVSEPGVDVYEADVTDLMLDSSKKGLIILDIGTASVSKAGSDNAENVVIAHGLGYAPLVIAFCEQVGAGSYIPVPEVVPDISTGLIAKMTSLYVDDTNIVLSVITPSWVGNTFYTDPLDYNFTYYILQKPAA